MSVLLLLLLLCGISFLGRPGRAIPFKVRTYFILGISLQYPSFIHSLSPLLFIFLPPSLLHFFVCFFTSYFPSFLNFLLCFPFYHALLTYLLSSLLCFLSPSFLIFLCSFLVFLCSYLVFLSPFLVFYLPYLLPCIFSHGFFLSFSFSLSIFLSFLHFIKFSIGFFPSSLLVFHSFFSFFYSSSLSCTPSLHPSFLTYFFLSLSTFLAFLPCLSSLSCSSTYLLT